MNSTVSIRHLPQGSRKGEEEEDKEEEEDGKEEPSYFLLTIDCRYILS